MEEPLAEIGDRVYSVELFREIAAALNEATDMSTAMDLLLPKLSDALGLSTAWAFRYDPHRRTFVEVGASGLPPALACNHAATLKSGWCECQDQFVRGRLNTAVNVVRCSRLRDAVGEKNRLSHHASIPLRSKGKALGILNLAASGHRVFTDSALTFLSAVGQQVAIAVDRAGLLADERQRTAMLHRLGDASADLVSVVNPDRLLQFACDCLVETLGYQACGVVVRSSVDGADDDELDAVLVAVSEAVSSEVIREYSYTADRDEPLLSEGDRMLLPDARSFLEVPIPHSAYGLRLESTIQHAFRDIDEEMAGTFAWHITAALENARLYQQSLASAAWTERRHLAADLHDSVSQRLFSSLLIVRTITLLLDQSDNQELIRGTIKQLEAVLTDGQTEMRRLIETLRPNDERGFEARLRAQVATMQLQGQTRFHLRFPEDHGVQLPIDVRECLLSVINEALQNVMKHARARNAYVTVHEDGVLLHVSIVDDGIGFSAGNVRAGIGTSTMHERMLTIGGSLRLRSEVGKGTTVRAEWPIHRQDG